MKLLCFDNSEINPENVGSSLADLGFVKLLPNVWMIEDSDQKLLEIIKKPRSFW